MTRPFFYNIIFLTLFLVSCASPSYVYSIQRVPNTVYHQPVQNQTTQAFNQAVAAPISQTGYLANPNVQAFMRYQNQVHGLDTQYLNNFFAQAAYRGNIIDIMNRPSTSRPWYEFHKNNANATKIAAGKKFYQTHQAVIDAAAARYGVPPEVIVAIIGIETHYGSNTGSIRVADSLATLAFDYPRRAAFFQKELSEFLKLAQEEKRSPFEFMGSYAGAMGLPQFMPSSFRQWAVDFDLDGRRDIWRSVPDTAASIAHYLKQHGWQTGGRMVIPVSMPLTPQLLSIVEQKTALTYTVGQLRQMGVMPQQTVSDQERAVLYRLEIAPKQFAYFIGLNNFYSVWHYNNSRMYVTAVRDIANGIRNSHL
ncbi:MAG: lytic murein transglycosylase B [Alysiella sp.]|uniref:lytic murein transglycosylase B n=1 Tax=Alysiella sp. TaxID=1872483 RepID=UPI0026DC62E0|nr:lytic murein transglycosylase B [Alysiella sp.]MDO4434547.1 lytic murein transglycosylase B [Alysiella sp.]